MLPQSRTAAKLLGEKRFNTGKPCKLGHLSDRYVANGQCVECSRAQAIEYTKTDQSKEARNTPAYKAYRAQFNARYHKTDKKREYTRDWKLQANYGITIDQYNVMVQAQDSKCKICKITFDGIGTAKSAPCVDHCHATGKVRGILCMNCNKLLGMAKDDISILANAIHYLQTE